ncbi:MAG: hypothetical protein L3K07_06305 [Thermoplasmata archaeon]|nr:hypothetical protein [Thermoplasmata archaeon]
MATPPTASLPTPTPPPKSRTLLAAILVVFVVIVVAVAGLYVAKVGPFAATKSTPTQQSAGFTLGQVVTFQYTGNFNCSPSLVSFYPSATAAAASTGCEVGAANQNTFPDQIPEWLLIPAFAGMSVFGLGSLGASARGFAMVGNAALPPDCGAGGTPTACVDHPTNLYSPTFATIEQFTNASTGYGGLPEGVLPVPAHDQLVNTSPNTPNVEWGTIVVLVFDPNIFPDRATGACTASTPSNLSSATGNCLTSLAALERAVGTHSSAVVGANGGNPGNPVWKALGGGGPQVLVLADPSVSEINNLNSNLYIPFSTQPGAPSSFPT